jgi:DNA modification methylase
VRLAYADPPYAGSAKKIYGDLHADAARWDDPAEHVALVGRLTDEYDGWVFSCNPKDLRWLLPACPEDARVASWVKTFHQIRPTTTQYAWEPVIFWGGRKRADRTPMVRDWFQGNATRLRGTPGAKPEAFCRWLLDLLGYEEGDVVDDLFPGSGVLAAVVGQGVLL